MLSAYFIKKGSGVYDRLEERVIIEPDCLRSVCNQIRAKNPHENLPDYKIGIIIGGHKNTISNALAGSSIPYKVFKRLEKLHGKPIILKITTPLGEKIELEENGEIAEFITIMLGDGYLGEYSIIICLNGVDEYPYVKYVRKLMTRVLKKEPEEIWSKDNDDPTRTKGIKLRVYSLAGVDALKKAGLVSGDKVKHRVSIPQRYRRFIKACLKGLIDTDGSIWISKKDKCFRISFVNGSRPLVENFKQLSEKLGINTSKVNPYLRKEDHKYNYSVIISSKTDVNKFLEIVNPEKWKDKNRRKYWGITLIYLNTSKKIREAIESQI
ncbi:MAG: LAGLIDADG family homing endonuclease [Candidatus Lokiarchaeia archaeon]